MHFHHFIKYPDGRKFPGEVNHYDSVGFLDLDVKGKTVLDIATNDGFWAFWSEMHGASEVTAIDVGNYRNYEWGYDGPPPEAYKLGQQDKWEVFNLHHKNLNSKVRPIEMSVYDITGSYDIVFNFGLLYHIRNPLLMLDKCRAVTNGVFIMKTEVLGNYGKLPINMECGPWTGIMSMTDNFCPTESVVCSWMKKACFPYVFAQKEHICKRQLFIGAVTQEWKEVFESNSEFRPVDEKYWEEVKETFTVE